MGLNRHHLLFFAFSVVLLAGCGLSPVQTKPTHTYTLTQGAPHQSHSERAETSYVLLVKHPIGQPPYKGANMYYTKKPHVLKSYSLNQWAAPPTDMLQQILAQRIEADQVFAHVTKPPFYGHYDYTLRTQLMTLRQEFFKPVSQVRLVIRTELMSEQSNKLLASRTFQVVEKAPGNNPYSGVKAAQRAANELSHRIACFVAKTVRDDHL